MITKAATGAVIAALLAGAIPESTAVAAPGTEENIIISDEERQTSENEQVEDGEREISEEALAGLAETASYEDMENLGLYVVDDENVGEPDRIKPKYEETSYVKDVFFTQTTMQGIFSSSELYFYIPEYWETDYVYVELEYRVSQLIQEIASSMTFYVNQLPVSSCKITYENGDSQIAYVKIPVELVKEGYNSFRVSAYAKLYSGEGCTDDFSDANWLSISDTSYIRCGYEVKEHGHKIACYPYPFLSTTDETAEGLSIAVSDRATNAEVAAAMNLMADLSGQTASENRIEFTLLSDLKESKKGRTILVSEYDNLPADLKKKVADTSGTWNQGIVIFTDDSKGNPLLIITSGEEKCLMEAVYMLMDEDRVSQEKGSCAKVAEGSAEIISEQSKENQMAAGNYTLSDLAGGGLNFVGPFHQEQYIYLPFSEDYYLSESGKITLYFRYSENLDFNRSLISVYWGNVPVVSKKLSKENASGDELTFTIPADVAGTAAGAIRIDFDLELQDMFCTPRQNQMPWAYVSDESLFYLPASSIFDLSFDSIPSPFRADGKFNDVLLVISDNPDSDELNLYAQIVGMYGEGVAPYGSFKVKRAGEFAESDADYNIIAAGTYSGNSFLKMLNDKLYFPYSSGGDSFESNDQLILSGDYAKSIAILQLLKSPYADDRGILVLTGASEETLDYAEAFMRDGRQRYSLSKDCVIIDEESEIRAFQFIVKSTVSQEPTLAETLDHNKQSILFTIVATSVMLMLLIAVIIILIRIKTYHKKQDEE